MNSRPPISTTEITKSYLRATGECALRGGYALETDVRELTATARYVSREAKKRLGQHRALGQNGSGEGGGDFGMISESALLELIRSVEGDEGEILSDRERTAVVASLAASLDHYDILTPLLRDPEINDILVRSYDDISVQKNRLNFQTSLRFADPESYRSFVEHLLKRTGRACTMATPVVDVAIDPHIRVCVTHESFSPPGSGPMLTLRVARHRTISLDGLAVAGLAPEPMLAYLRTLVATGEATLLIAGEVGTGKTTLVKALVHETPPSDAVLIIEDTHELVLNRPFVRTLLTREANSEGSGRITPAQAIRTGMRMAMNRLVLGEMRDAEAAEAFVDVCASGHAGMSTIHARSARDALARLELFLARRQGSVSDQTIRRQVANAVSVVVYLGLDPLERRRRVLEVLEIGSSSDGAIQTTPIFRCRTDREGILWQCESGATLFREHLIKHGAMVPRLGDVYRSSGDAPDRHHAEMRSFEKAFGEAP